MEDIKLDPNNYRIHDDKNKRLIKKSLEECGAGRSVLMDKEDYLIAGNGVYEQAKELGIPVRVIETDGKELVVVKRTDLSTSDDRRKLLALADNHTSDTSEFDYKLVIEDFQPQELKEWEIDIPELPIEENSDIDNDIPQYVSYPFVKTGMVIEMNNHRLMCGDSCNIENINLLMNGKQSDMIFTDPPYDLKDNYSKLILSIAKTNSHVFIMNSDRLLIQNIQNNIDSFRKMFYVDFRIARLVSNNQPMTRVDPIAEFCKGKTRFNNLKDGFSTLIECAKVHSDKLENNFGFKQTKRVELPETFIIHYSKPNELICDFFGGSGSTLIAAEKNNRICYINEFDKSHCDIILKRWILYMIENNKLFEVKINGKKIDDGIIKKIAN